MTEILTPPPITWTYEPPPPKPKPKPKPKPARAKKAAPKPKPKPKPKAQPKAKAAAPRRIETSMGTVPSREAFHDFLKILESTGSHDKAFRGAGVTHSEVQAYRLRSGDFEYEYMRVWKSLAWMAAAKLLEMALDGDRKCVMFMLERLLPESFGDRSPKGKAKETAAPKVVIKGGQASRDMLKELFNNIERDDGSAKASGWKARQYN